MNLIDSRVVVSQQQVSSELGEELAILNITNKMYYGLDEVGNHIWSLLQTPIKVTNIISDLLEEYEVKPDQCKVDVLAFLEDLMSENLIEVV